MVIKHKGWLITAVIALNIGWSFLGTSSFMEFWLTKDQQAQISFDKGEYQRAASLYQDTFWKAQSAYLAGDFASTISFLEGEEAEQARFLTANAYAYSGQFKKAMTLYKSLLESEHYAEASADNLKVMKAAIQKIKDAPPESLESEKKLDDRQLAMDESGEETGEPLQLSDQAWLKQVRQDPSKFLRQKFQQEYANEQN